MRSRKRSVFTCNTVLNLGNDPAERILKVDKRAAGWILLADSARGGTHCLSLKSSFPSWHKHMVGHWNTETESKLRGRLVGQKDGEFIIKNELTDKLPGEWDNLLIVLGLTVWGWPDPRCLSQYQILAHDHPYLYRKNGVWLLGFYFDDERTERDAVRTFYLVTE